MKDLQRRTDILIVGAGMAGLSAADKLRARGREVLVIDKGRGVGGRLASRRIGGATFDHGAQFLTARVPRFAASVDRWLEEGVLEEWYRTSAEDPDGRPHWRGKPTMTAIAKHLAREVEVLLAKRMVSLRPLRAGWVAEVEGDETILASAVLLTPPVPQTLDLLESCWSNLSRETRERLEGIEYERCLAVLAVLDGPSRVPAPGMVRPPQGSIASMADNQTKGVSATPAVTIHGGPAFSLEHWDRDRQESGRELLQAAGPWLGSGVIDFQVHGWRHSKPLRVEESPCLVLSLSPPLVLAGDAFAGPRVEGAALSGWAAADALAPNDA